MKRVIICVILASFAICTLNAVVPKQTDAIVSSPNSASQSGISYDSYVDNGYIYLRYNNTTDKYYIIKYTYTNTNGDRVSNYVEAKPKVKTSVQIGKGTGFRVTECRAL